MASSTSHPERERRFWPLAEFPVSLLASARKCSTEEALAYLAAAATGQADPTWIDAMLDRLSVPALAVLSVLAAHRTIMSAYELDARLEERFALGELERAAGKLELIGHALAVPLTTYYGDSFGLVSPAAELVSERVADLDLAPLGDAPFEPISGADGGRTLLAVCALLAQLELKVTRDGYPHRGGIKRIAKQVALDEDVLERYVVHGIHVGLLTETEDAVVRPDREALTAATRGRFPRHPSLDAVALRMREAGAPIGATTIDRWAHSAIVLGRRGVSHAMLDLLPGFLAGSVSGVRAYTARPPVAAAPAVTITPSFEVFLPPETPLADVVSVLGLCEPVRLDRVIVARLTKASVVRASSTGAQRDLVELLTAASRTPLPQNVAASIRDWIGGAVSATLAEGHVIVVPPADETRAAAALASFAPRVLAPGVLVIEADVTNRALSNALGKIGIHASTPAPVVATERIPGAQRSDTAALMALPVAARPGLARRVAAYRAGDPGERARVIPMKRTATAPPAARVGALAPDGDVLELDPAVGRAIIKWEERVGAFLDEDQYDEVASHLADLPDFDRRFVLKAEDPAGLIARLARLTQRDVALRRAASSLSTRGATGGAASARHVWIREHLHAHLEAAARTHARYVLDLGDRALDLAISAVMMRGKTLMVLGDDRQDRSVAIRFDAIRGIAEPVDEPGRASRPWRPVDGESPPPGHSPCPCGSGERYRNCCRAQASPPS